MHDDSVDRELNRLHVGIKVSFIRASLCACAANFWNLIRKAFNNSRMISYFDNPSQQVGFIPDIHRSLEKYSLSIVMQEFIENGTFMSKYSWKRILKVNNVFAK